MDLLFTRFGKLLFSLTVIVVLTFQGYWLYNNFQNKKKEILEQTKLEMQQILIRLSISNLELKAITGSKEINIEKLNPVKLHKKKGKPNVYFYKTFIEMPEAPDQVILKKEVLRENTDSMLYHTVNPVIQKLYKNSNVTLYYENKDKKIKRTYPSGMIIKNTNTTDFINTLSEDNGTIRLHIENLSGIVIRNMLGSIFFSILYLILFFGTLFILFKNLTFNQKLFKNKEMFTRNMTHELKIPISTLSIAAEGLEKYDIANEPESVRKYAQTIQKANSQLTFLIESILQHAKADSNRENFLVGPVNLLTLLTDTKELLSHLILSKEASILFDNIPENLHLKGNYMQLRQILLNLIDNSLKYSEKPPEVIIFCEKIQNYIIIKIKDNGIGIPAKYREEIFDPYFRIAHEDLHDVKGFGLGLSFVRASLKNQGGKIYVSYSGTDGTIMELKIPSYE